MLGGFVFMVKKFFTYEALVLLLGALLGTNSFAQATSTSTPVAYNAAYGSTYTDGVLSQGDNIIEKATNVTTGALSIQTRNFLKQIRKTAEQACTGGLGPMASGDACTPYGQAYVDSAKFFIAKEKKAGELKIGVDMMIRKGNTESGEAAKVVEAPCDGSGQKDEPAEHQSNVWPEQNSKVVATMYDAASCDKVKPNFPQDGILSIDSRNHARCDFYFVCSGKFNDMQMPKFANTLPAPAPTSNSATPEKPELSTAVNTYDSGTLVNAALNAGVPQSTIDQVSAALADKDDDEDGRSPTDVKYEGPTGYLEGKDLSYYEETGVRPQPASAIEDEEQE